jgi:hypothetical protein
MEIVPAPANIISAAGLEISEHTNVPREIPLTIYLDQFNRVTPISEREQALRAHLRAGAGNQDGRTRSKFAREDRKPAELIRGPAPQRRGEQHLRSIGIAYEQSMAHLVIANTNSAAIPTAVQRRIQQQNASHRGECQDENDHHSLRCHALSIDLQCSMEKLKRKVQDDKMPWQVLAAPVVADALNQL